MINILTSAWNRQISQIFTKEDEQYVSFQCNICGRFAKTLRENLTREKQTCKCRSTVRQRSIIYLLSKELFGQPLIIPEFPQGRHLIGLDMSGAENYAKALKKKLGYINTYLHKTPYLDITSPSAHWVGKCDFVISSDVFEHVPPPVSLAFSNTFKLLKPGGILFLTVPYNQTHATLEHFPELHQYELKKENGTIVLQNVTLEGNHQKFENLNFHGGEGETLEMRVFSETGLIQALLEAGFVDISIQAEPYAPYGIAWAHSWSLPVTAKRPK